MEEDEGNKQESQKSTKRKNEEEPSLKGPKAKLMKNDLLDDEKSKNPNQMEVENDVGIEDLVPTTPNNFGPFGKPIDNLYACPLCPSFKTKYKHDMRDHLMRELKYAR